MLKQDFFLDGQLVLEFYHYNFSIPKKRHIIDDNKNCELIEYNVNNKSSGPSQQVNLSGFLKCEHSKNPYSSFLSCDYKEFISYDIESKKKIIQNSNFPEFINFIKKHTYFDLEENLYSINNIFYFKTSKAYIEFKKDGNAYKYFIKGIKISSDDNLKFICIGKYNNEIIYYKEKKEQEGELLVPEYFTGIDLWVFLNDELIYCYEDLTFIDQIEINLGINQKKQETKLNKAKMSVEYKVTSKEKINVGNSNEDERFLKTRNILSLEKSLNNIYYFTHKDSTDLNLLHFLTKRERERAYEILKNITSNAEEIYVFDPYLFETVIEKNKAVLDAFNIFASNIGTKKNIILYRKDNLSEENWRKFIKNIVEEFQKRGILDEIKNDFVFMHTTIKFHDRFIFTKDISDKISCFYFGTSLDSLGDNYSVIQKLPNEDGIVIFDILNSEILEQNVVNEVKLADVFKR